MTHTEFLLNSSDGMKLFAQKWLPQGEVRASINLVHGLGEHSGRYFHVANALNQAGFALTAFDLRGHGKTGGVRGHIPSYDAAAEDINHLVEESTALFPGIPQFLYGHSLGGALVLFTSLFHNPKINGVIASSPGLDPGSVPPAKLFAVRLLSKLAPSFTMTNGLDVSNLSHDKAVIDAYQRDPLVHPMVSCRLGYELITNGRRIADYQGIFPYPLLLLQGAEDHLVNPTANQRFASQLSGSTTSKVFTDGYHELHNDPWNDKVISFMIDWIKSFLN